MVVAGGLNYTILVSVCVIGNYFVLERISSSSSSSSSSKT